MLTIKKQHRIKPLTEHEIQCQVIAWFDLVHKKYAGRLFAIPNAGDRPVQYTKQLIDEGMRSGVPDLCLPVARGGYHALYIELKRPGGRLSEKQNDWINFLNDEKNLAVCCVGFSDAKRAIDDYLKL
jgi:hypothetical protein